MEHRAVWEANRGPIPEGMAIHHVNGNNRDNRIENLQLVTPAEHRHIHAGYESRDGVPYKRCCKCGQTKPLTEFYRYCYYPYDGAISACKPCHRQACSDRQRKIRQQRRSLSATADSISLPGGE
ncbi:MAG: hypothetical protein BIFFINMI_02817 [Phycisphaerae bacterium]|nr:hypothetical protein [Phycisphaerae bacterium]